MTHTLGKWAISQHQIISKCRETQTKPNNKDEQAVILPLSTPFSRRRCAILTPLLSITLISLPPPSFARERRSRKTIPLEDYLTSSDGLKYYDIDEGRGPVAVKGSIVQVHFDCVYRGITAVSSRESKLLAGNRIIAQPYVFQVGSTPGRERKREFVDNPNGLFSAQAAPKPPPALYSIVEGMKLGGKEAQTGRIIGSGTERGGLYFLDEATQHGNALLAHGSPEYQLWMWHRRLGHPSPGATFNLNVELLQVIPPEKSS